MAFFRATFFHRFTFYLTCNDKIIKITEIYIVTQLRQDFPRTLNIKIYIRSYQNKCYFGYEHSYYSVFNCVYTLLKVADYVAKNSRLCSWVFFVAGFFWPSYFTSYSCHNTLKIPEM